MQLTGVILAGGQSTRMGGQDKGLINVAGRPLYQHVLSRLKPQVDTLLINANQNITQYQESGYPVIMDIDTQFRGPLAGILTGLEASKTEWVLFSSCDTPSIPLNLLQVLSQGLNKQKIAFAHDGQQPHPTHSLIHTSIKIPLRQYLLQQNRKVMIFFEQQQASTVYFYNQEKCFYNLNTPEDCINWEQQQ